jgi:DNA-binding Lrp family transcriptional regulator
MSEDTEYEKTRDQVVEHLKGVGGKGADTIVSIAKKVGLHRKEVSKILRRMEEEGLVQSAGVAAGVAGYKLTQ